MNLTFDEQVVCKTTPKPVHWRSLHPSKRCGQHHGGWWPMALFPALDCFVEKAGKIRRPHEQSMFHHKGEFFIVKLQEDHSTS